MNTSSDKEETLFNAARMLTDPAHRKAFLDQACRDQLELRAKIEMLLEAEQGANAFFDSDPLELEATTDSNSATLPFPKPLTSAIGRYKPLQQIGEGGFGLVYMAEQQDPIRRRVALKILKPGMDTKQIVARFEAERQALALMDHPNIARIHDGGATEHGRPYFVMELVRGIPITDFCDQKQLNTKQRLELFLDVCSAIQHAHQKGLIHRDLKPSNILVTVNDDRAVAKVIDFGIAKATDQRLTDKTLFTRMEQAIGTPNFMSPEQVGMSSVDIDTRSDVYSLGALLYVILTGQNPFELSNTSWEEIRRQIKEKEPSRPSLRLAELPDAVRSQTAERRAAIASRLESHLKGDLDWIVMKAMEKDRQRRYETANELAADLQRHLRSEPIMARPPSTLYRIQKAWQRHRLVICTAALVAIAILLAGTFGLWKGYEAEEARAGENSQRIQAEKNAATARKEAIRATEFATTAAKSERVARRRLYQSDMQRIPEAYQQGDLDWIRTKLNDHRPTPWDATDLRGWEWFYWWQATHLQSESLKLGQVQASAASMGLSLSPDGRRLAITTSDSYITIHDAGALTESQIRVPIVNSGHAFFTPDSKWIIAENSLRGRGTLDVYSAATYELTHTLNKVANGSGIVLALAANMPLMAVRATPNSIRLWNTETWQPIRQQITTAEAVDDLALSADGKTLVGITRSWIIWWEVHSGNVLHQVTVPGRNNPILAYSAELNCYGSANDSGVTLWGTQGQQLSECRIHTGSITSLDFSPDGRRLLVATESDSYAHIVHITQETKTLSLNQSLKLQNARVKDAIFVDAGRQFVTLDDNTEVSRWSLSDAKDVETLHPSDRPIELRFAPGDHDTLLLPTAHGSVLRWHQLTQSFLEPLNADGTLSQIVLSSDGSRYGGIDESGRLGIWDTLSGKRLLSGPLPPSETELLAVDSSARYVVWDKPDFVADLWIASLNRTIEFGQHHYKELRNPVVFLPQDNHFLVTLSRGQTDTWDFSENPFRLVARANSQPADNEIRTLCLTVSRDGLRLASGDSQGNIHVSHTLTGEPLHTFRGHKSRVNAIAFSPDSSRLVSSGDDRVLKFWDAMHGALISTISTGQREITSVEFSHKGNTLASLGHQGEIQLWRTAPQNIVNADVDFWLGLGRAQESLSNLDRAQQAYEAGLQLNQANLRLQLRMGDLHFRQARWEEAIQSYRAAMQSPAVPARIHLQIAKALSHLNRRDEVIDALIQYNGSTLASLGSGSFLAEAKNILQRGRALITPLSEWRYVIRGPETDQPPPKPEDYTQKGKLPFGPQHLPSSRSIWEAPDDVLWLANEFDLQSLPQRGLLLHIAAACNATVFINGIEVAQTQEITARTGTWNGSSNEPVRLVNVPLPPKAPLKQGRNSITIQATNHRQYGMIDFWLSTHETHTDLERLTNLLVHRYPDSALLQLEIANYYRQEEFNPKRAAAAILRSMELDPVIRGLAERAAALLLLANDLEGYQTFCSKLIRDYGHKSDSFVRRSLVTACVAGATAIDNPMVKDFVKSQARTAQDQTIAALTAYRLGQLELAQDRINAIETQQWNNPFQHVRLQSLQAMIHHQRGEHEKALSALAPATQTCRTQGNRWFGAEYARALHQEAQRLLTTE